MFVLQIGGGVGDGTENDRRYQSPGEFSRSTRAVSVQSLSMWEHEEKLIVCVGFVQHWESFSPQLCLREIFSTSADVHELLKSGQLILDDR